jgi:hypothetical protein
MRTKYIEMEFPDGTRWRINAYLIAVERAYFWVENINENHLDYDNALNDEIEYALSSDGFDDLIHFMENLMDWNELEREKLPSLLVKPMYDYWLNSGNFLSKPVAIEND